MWEEKRQSTKKSEEGKLGWKSEGRLIEEWKWRLQVHHKSLWAAQPVRKGLAGDSAAVASFGCTMYG